MDFDKHRIFPLSSAKAVAQYAGPRVFDESNTRDINIKNSIPQSVKNAVRFSCDDYGIDYELMGKFPSTYECGMSLYRDMQARKIKSATIKIQSHWRGYNVRKNLKKKDWIDFIRKKTMELQI